MENALEANVRSSKEAIEILVHSYYCGYPPLSNAKKVKVKVINKGQIDRWEGESLGWFPKPQGEPIVNSIFKDNFASFYHSFWANCPRENRFRQGFIQEGKRQ